LIAVINQASIVKRWCQRGGMIAVLADPAVYRSEALSSHCEIAGINSSSHFIVAAPNSSLGTIESLLRNCDIVFSRLPVSYAFHSRWIDEAEQPFRTYFESVVCAPARIPVVCAAKATTLWNIPHEYFWTVARNPIRLYETIVSLEQNGTYRYIDIGPSASLAASLKYILPVQSKSIVNPALSPYGYDARQFELLSETILTGEQKRVSPEALRPE
jgi:bacillaene synthase trans-acting acyltransferase